MIMYMCICVHDQLFPKGYGRKLPVTSTVPTSFTPYPRSITINRHRIQ